MRIFALALSLPLVLGAQQKYTSADGHLRVALVKQPFLPDGQSKGPSTMAEGGIQAILSKMGATVRVDSVALTADENTEYGGWKRIGMFWLDAHPDFNTPETTRSGSLGGMPVAVATGRALQRMRMDAGLDPPLSDRNIVMGGVRLTDPLEQQLLDASQIEQLSVDDLRTMSPAVFAQLDRLNRNVDKIYVHVDMDVLDPREVMGHVNKVPGGPTSAQLAALFEQIFARYPKASALGFATIPATDEGGLSLAAVNRMIEGAVRGLAQREQRQK
jgi:arginase family enzyme